MIWKDGQIPDTDDLELMEKDTVIKEEGDVEMEQYNENIPLFKNLRHVLEVRSCL